MPLLLSVHLAGRCNSPAPPRNCCGYAPASCRDSAGVRAGGASLRSYQAQRHARRPPDSTDRTLHDPRPGVPPPTASHLPVGLRTARRDAAGGGGNPGPLRGETRQGAAGRLRLLSRSDRPRIIRADTVDAVRLRTTLEVLWLSQPEVVTHGEVDREAYHRLLSVRDTARRT